MRRPPTFLRHTGFSLVEIMVGLAIGMLAALVIIQILSTFQTQQRTTTGNADAQTSGSVALYLIQREAQMAGYGLSVFDTSNPALLCNTVTNETTGLTTDIWPLSIIDGGSTAGSSDQLIVRYGDAQTGGTSVSCSGSTPCSGNTLNDFTTYFRPYLYASGPNNCPVTITDCSNTHFVLLSNGGTCRIAPITSTTTFSGGSTGSLAYLGNWTNATFSIVNNQLFRNNTEIAANIVNLQAQYGISTVASSNVVTQWVNASGTTWANPSINDRNRIKAIRIAIVARNDKPEGGSVTSACSSQTAPAPTGLCAWEGSATSPSPTIDISNNTDWQRYRYRVFETIIPLRNVIWSRNTLP